MLYVDQPIGVGFSYGTDSATSTVTAAEYVWAFLQNFYAAFPTYESRDFALFTESYGGHYGPEFASYFLSQNEAIDAGTISGEKINLVALGINNVSRWQAYPRSVWHVSANSFGFLGMDRPASAIPGELFPKNVGMLILISTPGGKSLLTFQAYPIFAYNNTYNQLITERQYEKYM